MKRLLSAALLALFAVPVLAADGITSDVDVQPRVRTFTARADSRLSAHSENTLSLGAAPVAGILRLIATLAIALCHPNRRRCFARGLDPRVSFQEKRHGRIKSGHGAG